MRARLLIVLGMNAVLCHRIKGARQGASGGFFRERAPPLGPVPRKNSSQKNKCASPGISGWWVPLY